MMELEMTGKQLWLGIESTVYGVDYIPEDLISVLECQALCEASEVEHLPNSVYTLLKEELFERVKDYTSCRSASDINAVFLMRGYGVRLTRPGYLDRTDWQVYETKVEAKQQAKQLMSGIAI